MRSRLENIGDTSFSHAFASDTIIYRSASKHFDNKSNKKKYNIIQLQGIGAGDLLGVRVVGTCLKLIDVINKFIDSENQQLQLLLHRFQLE